MNSGANRRNAEQLLELEMKTGLSFPVETILVSHGDGGGRDQSHGFYTWNLFSPIEIKMPITEAPGVKDYVNLPIDDTLRLIKTRMPMIKVTQPRVAFCSEWISKNYKYRGTLLRSPQGDYLIIEQFRNK